MAMRKELIVVVTGASRGIGRGIARAFGAAGATVYVTGRSRSGRSAAHPDEAMLPGTIDEAAAEVSSAGGKGIAVACDLADDTQVKALFERVEREHGGLDVLVNNAAFLHNDMMKPPPFWGRSVAMANIIDVGLRCHYVATHFAAPLMISRGRALVVNISFYGDAGLHDPAYHAAKAGLDKLAAACAVDFRPFGVAAVSLWPGIVTTERVLQAADQIPSLKEQLAAFESPEFVGRVILALYRATDLMALSGKTLIGAELAARYGVTDLNGRQPQSYRSIWGAPHKAFDVT